MWNVQTPLFFWFMEKQITRKLQWPILETVLIGPIFNCYMFNRVCFNPKFNIIILKTPRVVEILKNQSGLTPV